MDVQKIVTEKISEDKQRKMGEKIKDRIDILNSTELLKDFFTRSQKNALDTSNPWHVAILEALKNPENKEKIQAMQYLLWYKNPEGKIYYNPCRYDIQDGTFLQKTPDGKAGAFTIWAMNTAIVDPNWLQLNDMKYPNPKLENLKMDDETSKEGVKKFIGTLHPKFYDAFKNIDTSNLNDQGKTIVDTMQKIQKLEATKEDIQTMQKALHNLKVYPSIHNKEQKDGVPGQFTQIALQNFVFNYLK